MHAVVTGNLRNETKACNPWGVWSFIVAPTAALCLAGTVDLQLNAASNSSKPQVPSR